MTGVAGLSQHRADVVFKELFLLRCELDAAFFHLYGIARDDVSYMMDTFPVVRRDDEKGHGEYRTKRAILEIYDAMARAIAAGTSYQTIVAPPPGDRQVSHSSLVRTENSLPAVVILDVPSA
jgi:hypothetical protein